MVGKLFRSVLYITGLLIFFPGRIYAEETATQDSSISPDTTEPEPDSQSVQTVPNMGIPAKVGAKAKPASHDAVMTTTTEDATADSAEKPDRPYHLSTSNGLEGGKGRSSYQGFRLQDSLAGSLEQTSGENAFKEILNVSTSRRLRSLKNLADFYTGSTLDYDHGGFSLTADGGEDYTAFIYNPQTRTEIQLDSAVWNLKADVDLAQKFVMNPDSTLDWTWTGSYEEYALKMHTFELESKLNKTWEDEFSLWGQLSGSRQRQDSIAGTCTKIGDKTANSCSTLSSDVTYDGGIAGGTEWTPEKHDLNFQTGFDWLLLDTRKTKVGTSAAKNTGSVERTWLSTLSDVYSPLSWLDVNGYLQEGFNLDAKKNPNYWMLGLSVSMTY